jgi:hypothetical protein
MCVDLATTVIKCGKSLLMVINDILDFSKIESGKLLLENSPFCALMVVEDVLEIFAPTARKKGIELVASMNDSIPPLIYGDVLRVRQVLTNLVGNALKFTSHGEVIVTIHNIIPIPSTLIQNSANDAVTKAQQSTTVGGAETLSVLPTFSSIAIGANDASSLASQFSSTIQSPAALSKSVTTPSTTAPLGSNSSGGMQYDRFHQSTVDIRPITASPPPSGIFGIPSATDAVAASSSMITSSATSTTSSQSISIMAAPHVTVNTNNHNNTPPPMATSSTTSVPATSPLSGTSYGTQPFQQRLPLTDVIVHISVRDTGVGIPQESLLGYACSIAWHITSYLVSFVNNIAMSMSMSMVSMT